MEHGLPDGGEGDIHFVEMCKIFARQDALFFRKIPFDRVYQHCTQVGINTGVVFLKCIHLPREKIAYGERKFLLLPFGSFLHEAGTTIFIKIILHDHMVLISPSWQHLNQGEIILAHELVFS